SARFHRHADEPRNPRTGCALASVGGGKRARISSSNAPAPDVCFGSWSWFVSVEFGNASSTSAILFGFDPDRQRALSRHRPNVLRSRWLIAGYRAGSLRLSPQWRQYAWTGLCIRARGKTANPAHARAVR